MQLSTPKELKKSLPLSPPEKELVAQDRKQIADCLSGTDPRILIIMGPCSLHNYQSALTYAAHIKELQHAVEDQFLLVMRAYIEKPRTLLGWKGPLYDPNLNGKSDLQEGLLWTRETLRDLIKCNVPLATEFLEPLATPYFEDLISLGFIGSRTASSQIHRQLASSLPLPIAFKNTPDGSTLSAINGMLSASVSHSFFHINEDGEVCHKQSQGNPNTTLALRGADNGPNYDDDSVNSALHELEKRHLPMHLIIDCSHGNSQKEPSKQREVFKEVVEQIAGGQEAIRGVMIEGHLEGGNQPPSSTAHPNLSITDPCMDWKTTSQIILSAHNHLSQSLTPTHSV